MKKTVFSIVQSLHQLHFYLIVAVLSLIFLSGCKDEKITPCGCENIVYWASDTCSFSWSEYNSLKQVTDYFNHHDSTIITHVRDTLKFWGWVYFHGPGEPIYYPSVHLEEAWTPDAKLIHLVGNEDHHEHRGLNGNIVIEWTNSFLQENPWFTQNFDSLLMKKWYVTAILEEKAEVVLPCHWYDPKYIMVRLDTLPNNN